MNQLEVFFDYACPYCWRAHQYLEELAPLYPTIEIVWRPCEAHPRPDRYGPHSDLLIQGMFFAQEKGISLWDYHKAAYEAVFIDRKNVEELCVMAGIFASILDRAQLEAAIKRGTYLQTLHFANQYAYEECGVYAVPSYRFKGNKLDSIEDVGVGKSQLNTFLGGT